MSVKLPANLFILEMANNHMGDILHGIKVIRTFGEVCRKYPQFNFAFKLQYRDLDTFIHPDAKGRDDIKYVKRFSETRLSRAEFDQLIAEMRAQGFLTMSTPFDERSVDLIEEQNLDIIKIASCSFGDWPLFERIAATNKPIIASTAGARLEVIDRVISFLHHRKKDFAIMHCVGEYPTANEHMHLSQIDFLKSRYSEVRVGFSTHESPEDTDIVKIAFAKGASIFEKHVGVLTDNYQVNSYSATPDQVDAWLAAAQKTLILCGVGDTRIPFNKAEADSLRSLRRGMFAKRAIGKGKKISADDIYFAFPPEDNQYTANDFSKYAQFVATDDIQPDGAISPANSSLKDMREKVWDIVQRIKNLLSELNISVPGGIDLEISHHYGLEQFDRYGLTMMTIVNRGYCKKLLVVLPGQYHPEQYHEKKEETFQVLAGDFRLELDNVARTLVKGDVITVEPGVRHAFTSENGAVIEEISSTHFRDDSFYTDPSISGNTDRKTHLTHWMS